MAVEEGEEAGHSRFLGCGLGDDKTRSVDARAAVSNARLREFWMITHPLLDEPQLAAATADVVLTCRIKHADIEAALNKKAGEVCSEFDLMVVLRRQAFVSFAYDAYRRIPDRWVEC